MNIHRYIVSAIQHLLMLHLSTDLGLEPTAASLVTSLVFAASLVSKVAFGVALDSRHRRPASLGAALLLVVGCALTLRLGFAHAGALSLAMAHGS